MQMNYAGFWRRFAAFIIDGIILTLIAVVFGFLHGYLLSWFASFLYTPFFESSALRGTPGKAVMELQVVDMQGQRISFKRAVIRFFMRIVSSLLLCIGFLMMLFTEKKQTLHDLAAETLVLHAQPPAVNYLRAWYEQLLEVLGMVDKVPENKENNSHSVNMSEVQPTPAAPQASTPASVPVEKAFPTSLAELYELLLKGAITEQEYNQKKEEILKKL